MIIDATFLNAFALLLLRLIIAIILFSSGKSHVQDPVDRGKSIGLSTIATSVLGFAEIIGALSIALGIFPQIGALIIMLAMLGAIYKKIFIWKTGFYAEEGFGWHYDLLIFLGALVIFTTAGGSLVIF